MKHLTVEQLHAIKEGKEQGLTIREIKVKVGVAKSTAERVLKAIKEERFAAMVVKAQMRAAGQRVPQEKPRTVSEAIKAARRARPNIAERAQQFRTRKSKRGQYAQQIAELHAQAIAQSEIARRLGLPKTTVGYYVHARPKRQAL